MSTINQILTSGEAVDALEIAIRALAGGGAAVDAAIAQVIAARPTA